jgi:hypothetical protein
LTQNYFAKPNKHSITAFQRAFKLHFANATLETFAAFVHERAISMSDHRLGDLTDRGDFAIRATDCCEVGDFSLGNCQFHDLGHGYLPLGFLPVASDLPVWAWAMRAAAPADLPVRFTAS